MKIKLFVYLFIFIPYLSKSDGGIRRISWKSSNPVNIINTSTKDLLYFEGANYRPENSGLPIFFEKVKYANYYAGNEAIAKLSYEIFEPCSDKEEALVKDNSYLYDEIKINCKIGYEKKEAYLLISFVPIRKNKTTGKYEKLVSFAINSSFSESFSNISSQKTSGKQQSQRTYKANSILSTGIWYKMGLSSNGICKLSYSFLKNLGMDVSTLDPRNIRIYGNGAGMLPFPNSAPRKDDLTENAIFVEGESKGNFTVNDYVLFYGENPNRWAYDKTDKRFHHEVNLYSDTTYYFITADLGPGKRIGVQTSIPQTATNTVTSFDDYTFHEKDLVNLLKSGKEWYGEEYDKLTTYSFAFNFPNLEVPSPVYVKTDLVARNTSKTNFNINAGGASMNLSVDGFIPQDFGGNDVEAAAGSFTFPAQGSEIAVTVAKITSGALGWLNYIELNARRSLIMAGDQMLFRDINSSGIGNISQFNLNSFNALQIWEVTDPTDINIQTASKSGSTYQFTVHTDSLREFIAFTSNSFVIPTMFGKISNQNLHALGQNDLIIVTHPSFINQANALADLHHNKDGLSVTVVTIEQVYNEFSSGAQDITAIRDFVKMFYDRAETKAKQPKYLLLLGDGSYDNKKRIPNNTNYIPTYESDNSTANSASYVSDDFYGLLDDNEGMADDNDLVDIGIGRLPVQSTGEAQQVIDKIIKYTSTAPSSSQAMSCSDQNNTSSFGDWRNTVCFISDDQDMHDRNDFIEQANGHARVMESRYKNYNIDKIYTDSYVQDITPAGQRYPEANEAINRRVEKGALIINYTGHGGELGWAHEEILGVGDINSWTNINRLPLFVTATCEFSKFDDPSRTSAGEYVLLNPHGGGIALLSTVRLVYGPDNAALNGKFYDTTFVKQSDGEMPRLGDLCRLVKGANASLTNNRKFILLGDPALRLAYPKYTVVTDNINGNAVSVIKDTLKALSLVIIAGHLTDGNGNKLSNYNGILYPTVFDKALNVPTLANDGSAAPFIFSLRKNILYKGKASINNGEFTFSFVVPSGISKEFGIGKISYYAENGAEDANGFYEKVVIGGISAVGALDKKGPEVELFMNDNKFVFGGICNENAQLYAVLRDSSGINRSGSDIGHDIIGVLDANTKKEINLNDYYEADLNSYKSGAVRYPFSKLSEGQHNLKLKAWDVYNNSSQSYTEFVVAKSAVIALSHVFNYPNPFTTRTKFFFEHNQACESMEVQIQIYTISGILIKTINTNVHTEGFRAEPIDWDGRDDFGDKIGRGVYVYRIKVHSIDGSTANKFEKLVILN